MSTDIISRLKPDTVVRSPLFAEPVKILLTQSLGTALKLTGTGITSGRTVISILSPDQLATLDISPETQPFDGNATHFRLGVEARRLELAYEYDPYFALSIARIDPLPHQLEAVYDYFIKSPRIRFLLADDPGAGKTIMAGLLIQELKARGLLKRTLIVTPANLTFQWQRELKDKFRQSFEIVRGDVLRANYGSNPWQEKDQVITSISWVARIEDAQQSLLRSQWDLIIVDEAHKMSAAASDKKTLAYKLGEALSQRTDHYLLMTATPHKGDPENFALFLSLLDADVYGDVSSLHEAMERQSAPFYLRRVKEALITFPDPETGQVKKLFTRRNVQTVDFQIDDEEADFYDALTHYVEDQSTRAAEEGTARGRAIGFTMAMLQRRFASSLYAVRRTLERMKLRREKILADPAQYRQEQILKNLPDEFDDLTDEEQNQVLESLEGLVFDPNPDDLREEIWQLGKLIQQAQQLENREVESKLLKLKEVLTQHGWLKDPKMRLLIFTEHKDTLDYLAADGRDGRPLGKLREWGLTVTQIHGQMKIGDRDTPGSRIYAEREFKENCQVMVATEAAGEGINLQFCWLMINYDIPWNPVRLEQRMGRIHRYGQEKDCLILNFVSTNTREGRVLSKLFERVRLIEKDLDPHGMGKVFNVMGDIFPANQLERMIREMYARNLSEQVIQDRIVDQVDTDKFRRITESTLEGLARRELNLASVLGKAAEAKERRLVPEVIESFFVESVRLMGLNIREGRSEASIYRLGRLPRALLRHAETLESRFGLLGQEYRQITFRQETWQKDGTLEWVTPGHPLFEAARLEMWQQAQSDLERGAIFYDLQRAEPACLDVFQVVIEDGRGRILHQHLFVVETGQDGAIAIRQPTLFIDLRPAPAGTALPTDLTPAPREQAEQILYEEKLTALLTDVQDEREKEIATISRHLEISLNELIHRQNIRLFQLQDQLALGDTDPLLQANIQQVNNRLHELNDRLERRRAELQQERHCTISNIRHLGRAWVLPDPQRHELHLAPMVRDDEIERIAVNAVIAYEEAQGRTVQSVESEDKGFDLISSHPTHLGDVRYIEVKGRAYVGLVSLSKNEYETAYRLKKDYWLYVVFNCATHPEIHIINHPVHLPWQPIQEIIQYHVEAQDVMDEAARQTAAATPLDPIEQAFRETFQSRLKDIGLYNILVEGLSDKVYLELAAQRFREATGTDLLERGRIRIIAGRGTKKFAPEFGLLQGLEGQGVRYVVMLDGDEPGQVAADGLSRFGAQKNKQFFHLERPDFKDKGGKSWEVEIEDMLPWPLLEQFIGQYPDAIEARFQMGNVHKVVIQGKPLEREGQVYDFKMMLTERVRQEASVDDLAMLVELLHKARKCMGLKNPTATARS